MDGTKTGHSLSTLRLVERERRDAICQPHSVRHTTRRFRIEAYDPRAFSDEEEAGYGVETLGWYESEARCVGIEYKNSHSPILEIAIEITLVRTLPGREDPVRSEPRTQLVRVPATEHELVFDPFEDDHSPSQRLPLPEAWKSCAWDWFFNHLRKAEDMRRYQSGKTAKARARHAKMPGDVKVITSNYVIPRHDPNALQDTGIVYKPALETAAQSTYVVRLTEACQDSCLVLEVTEHRRRWVPNRNDLPPVVDTDVTEQYVPVKSGHGKIKGLAGDRSFAWFVPPRSWVKRARRFPAPVGYQVAAARAREAEINSTDVEAERAAMETERAERRQLDLETERNRVLGSEEIDHRFRRRHTGTARAKAREENVVRRARQAAAARRADLLAAAYGGANCDMPSLEDEQPWKGEEDTSSLEESLRAADDAEKAELEALETRYYFEIIWGDRSRFYETNPREADYEDDPYDLPPGPYYWEDEIPADSEDDFDDCCDSIPPIEDDENDWEDDFALGFFEIDRFQDRYLPDEHDEARALDRARTRAEREDRRGRRKCHTGTARAKAREENVVRRGRQRAEKRDIFDFDSLASRANASSGCSKPRSKRSNARADARNPASPPPSRRSKASSAT